MTRVGDIALFVAGFALVVVTLSSAVRTTMLPRGVHVPISRRVALSLRVVFRLLSGRSPSYENRDRIMALFGPVFLLLKYAGQAMVRAGGGSFVAISSTAAVFSAQYLASYSAGKAAVDQLVRVAANELGSLHIRVNSVQPGMTRTPTTAGAFANPPMIAAFLAEQPLARSGEVDDIAQAVRYFAGPESSWVTGQLLAVDGGNTLRSFIDYAALIPIPDTREVVLGQSSTAS